LLASLIVIQLFLLSIGTANPYQYNSNYLQSPPKKRKPCCGRETIKKPTWRSGLGMIHKVDQETLENSWIRLIAHQTS